jgi:hypothetical protein
VKIRGVLLGTLKEQISGGDPSPIDPKLIKLDRVEAGIVPVTLGFQRDKLVGKTTRAWLEDGRILFEAEVLNDAIPAKRLHDEGAVNKAAIGFMVETERAITAELAYDLEMKDYYGRTIKGGPIFEVGLTDANVNRNQPPFEVVEE